MFQDIWYSIPSTILPKWESLQEGNKKCIRREKKYPQHHPPRRRHPRFLFGSSSLPTSPTTSSSRSGYLASASRRDHCVPVLEPHCMLCDMPDSNFTMRSRKRCSRRRGTRRCTRIHYMYNRNEKKVTRWRETASHRGEIFFHVFHCENVFDVRTEILALVAWFDRTCHVYSNHTVHIREYVYDAPKLFTRASCNCAYER